MRGKFLVFLLSLLPLSFIARASANNGKDGNSEPVLQGYVIDAATRKPVQGVTVSITTAGSQEKRTVTTDACGSFRTSIFPPGEVVIVLEKKGFKPCRKEGVVLKKGSSVKMNFDICSDEDETSDIFHPLLRMFDDL